MDENAISIRGLLRQHPGADRAAVDGVDLDVRCGEVVALVGPDGAGKTSTLEVLEGYAHRDAGDVTVLGVDPAHAGAAWRARVGVVPQRGADVTGPHPEEVVRHLAAYYPGPRDPDEVLRLVGLGAGRRPSAAARRLDMALGILGRPAVLFLDEPTTGLDPRARRDLHRLVRALATEGTTILLTTPDLDGAEALADRLAVIADGRIVAEGTPATLGGRDTYRTTVRWQEHGMTCEEHTRFPTELVTELAAQHGGEVPGLVVARPTLADVYRDLIDVGDTG